jgi:hypothetical protein
VPDTSCQKGQKISLEGKEYQGKISIKRIKNTGVIVIPGLVWCRNWLVNALKAVLIAAFFIFVSLAH